MRIIPASLLLALLLTSCASRSYVPTGGPEAAVLTIKIGREKERKRVVIGFFEDSAPGAVANFKDLAARGFYDGMRFHRAFPNYLVQTGDPFSRRGDTPRSGTGGPGYTIPPEIRRKHTRGAVAMSRLPDDINPTRRSSGSQFYVCLQPIPKLDGDYTVFGEIIEGLDVLDAISNSPTNSNDFPLDKIVIKSISIEPRVAASATGETHPRQ